MFENRTPLAIRPLVFALVAGLGSGAALAAEDEQAGVNATQVTEQEQEQGSASVLRGSELMESRVENREGDDLGRVKDLVFNEEGDVRFVIIATGDAQAADGQLTAIPWSSINVEEEGRSLVVDATPDHLAEAPHFSADEWPDMSADSTWATRAESHFQAPLGEVLAEETSERDEEGVGSFASLDTDGDGKISQDEARQSARLEERFGVVDENGDGAIDQAEFSAFEAEDVSTEDAVRNGEK